MMSRNLLITMQNIFYRNMGNSHQTTVPYTHTHTRTIERNDIIERHSQITSGNCKEKNEFNLKVLLWVESVNAVVCTITLTI